MSKRSRCGERSQPDHGRIVALEFALLRIVDAANANPDPIHFAVRQAIDEARRVLSNDEED